MICPHCKQEFEGNFCNNCGKSPTMKNKCLKCGSEFEGNFCNNCGARLGEVSAAAISQPQPTIIIQNTATANAVNHGGSRPISPKSKMVAFVLCLLGGFFGIHRFYVGKIGTAILWICTGGMFFVGWIVDLVSILAGNFTDKGGLFLKK